MLLYADNFHVAHNSHRQFINAYCLSNNQGSIEWTKHCHGCPEPQRKGGRVSGCSGGQGPGPGVTGEVQLMDHGALLLPPRTIQITVASSAMPGK